MQTAGVLNEAILQLVRAHVKTPTRDNVDELRGLLGMEVTNDDDEKDDEGAAASVPASSSSSSGQRPPPKHFQKFLAIKKKGVPKEAILNSARIQEEDCAKLERLLDDLRLDFDSPKTYIIL